MPGGDRTGPRGQGSLTGRGFGNCLAYGIPAIAGAVAAFGFGRRRGFGGGFARGLGRGFGFGGNQVAPDNSNELAVLKEQAKAIQDRITELEKE